MTTLCGGGGAGGGGILNMNANFKTQDGSGSGSDSSGRLGALDNSGSGGGTPTQLTDVEFRQIWDSFNRLRIDGHLCDAVVVSGDVRFPVHRAILAANSPYFRALFTNGMRETNEREVQLAATDPAVMAQIVDYMYTRTVRITDDNARALLAHAERFMVQGLAERCADYITAKLSCTNVVGVLRFARDYYLADMEQAAWRFLLTNFVAVTNRSVEFLRMDFGDLVDVIADDALNVRREEDTFRAVIRWIDYDAASRSGYMAELMRRMRLGLVSLPFFLETVSNNQYVAETTTKCDAIVQSAWKLLYYIQKHGCRSVSLSNPLVRPRIPHDVMFAIGGWSGGSPISFIETFDVRADRWYSHPTLEDSSPRAYHGLAAMDDRIYVIGGFDGVNYYNSVRCFVATTTTWIDVAPMYTQRCYVSTAVAGGLVYALGGYDGNIRQNTAECYDPVGNQWTRLEPMLERRSDAGADALHDLVYIAGGFNGEHCLSTVEMYSPTARQWTYVDPLTTPRSGVSLVGWRGALYALGGFDGDHRLQTCETFCPAVGRWNRVGEMNAPRSNFAVGVVENVIYVVGGFNGNVTIPNVEWYDADLDCWIDSTDMNVNRSALKACVISGLTNVVDYTYYGQCRSADGAVVNAASGSDMSVGTSTGNHGDKSTKSIPTSSSPSFTSSSSDRMSLDDESL